MDIVILKDLPFDINMMINKYIHIANLGEKFIRKELQGYMIEELRFPIHIELFISKENIFNIRDILTYLQGLDIKDLYQQFKDISIIEKSYILNPIYEEKRIQLYGSLFNILKLKETHDYETFTYKQFTRNLKKFVIEEFEKNIYKMCQFLYGKKEIINDYVNNIDNYRNKKYSKRKYQNKVNNIAMYYSETYICRNKDYKNNFSKFLEKKK